MYFIKVYRKIRELGGFEKCEINIIEDNIGSKREARSIERFYVESLNPNLCLNTEIPGRTSNEWRKNTVKGKAIQKKHEDSQKRKDIEKLGNQKKHPVLSVEK